MTNQDPRVKIEYYQIELQKNPRSLAFPQLAELYIAENMLDEAEELLKRSLKFHPQSVSGLILLAKINQLKEQPDTALEILNLAIPKAPTNWAALLLRADIFLKKQKLKLALQDYKRVLLHNPQHSIARRAVAKLEILSADEFEEEVFEIRSIKDIHTAPSKVTLAETTPEPDPWLMTNQKMERILSLIDAFTVRHEYERALKLLSECRLEFGNHPEIQTRHLRLSQFENAEKIRPKSETQTLTLRRQQSFERQKNALDILLRRIEIFREQKLVP